MTRVSERLTKEREALCVCGHVHETVTLDGHASVFHRCRDKACSCNEFRSGSNKFERSKEWWMAKAEAEGDFVIGAGSASRSGAGTTLSEEERELIEEMRLHRARSKHEIYVEVGEVDQILAIIDRLSSVAPREEPTSLREMQSINQQRSDRWMAGSPGWTKLEIAGELAGEVGELANVCKKLRRSELGVRGNKVSDEVLMEQARGEIGDVMIVLMLTASKLGVDLQDAVCGAFNAKSEQMGFPERLRSDPVERREGNT